MRFLTPLLFFAAAGYVFWYNDNHTGSVMMFPFMDVLFPSDAGKPHAQGENTVVLLGAIGLLSLLWQLSVSWRYRQHLRGKLKPPK